MRTKLGSQYAFDNWRGVLFDEFGEKVILR
jgi:hypothetical protein